MCCSGTKRTNERTKPFWSIVCKLQMFFVTFLKETFLAIEYLSVCVFVYVCIYQYMYISVCVLHVQFFRKGGLLFVVGVAEFSTSSFLLCKTCRCH